MRTFKKIAFLATMTVILTTLLSACGSNATTPASGAGASNSGGQANTQVDKIMVSEVYHNLLYLPLYVANNQGFLKENRIEALFHTCCRERSNSIVFGDLRRVGVLLPRS